MRKRILSIILVLLMVAGVLPNVTLPAMAADTAITSTSINITSGNTYTINNATELGYFRDIVNTGNNCAGATIKLINNINSLGAWTSIGSFAGTFDGGGFIISGMTINYNAAGASETKHLGLFGIIQSGGTVKNLTVAGSSTVSVNSIYSSNYFYVGGIVGSNYGRIENCNNSATLSAANGAKLVYLMIGGIAGANYGTITGCKNEGGISAATVDVSSGLGVGGICGGYYSMDGAAGSVLNCYNTGMIASNTATSYVGGIVGLANLSKIENCYNTGAIMGSTANKAGIASYKSEFYYGATVSNCHNAYSSSTIFVNATDKATVTNSYQYNGTNFVSYTNSSDTKTAATLLTTLNAWVNTKASTNYYTWTTGSYPVLDVQWVPPTYAATVTVNKDGVVWSAGAPTITFGTTSASAVANGTSVANGTYNIYANGTDTGMDVTVSGAAASAALNYYTVTFKSEDNTSTLNTQTVLSGQTAVYGGATPTKTATAQYSYVFSKWVTTAGGAADATLSNIIAAKTVYASFTQTLQTYTITWKRTDSVGLGTTTVAYGGTPTYSIPTNTGYTFTGWTPTIVSVTGYATYTASWTADTYNISYTLNGGAATNPASYTFPNPAITLNNPTREGSTFLGWTGSNGETAQTSVTITASSTGNRFYTANWKANTPAAGAGYSINFETEKITVNSGYEVNTDAGFGAGTAIVNNASVNPSTTYYIRVAASGGVLASAYVSFTLPARPAAPTGITADKTQNSITVTTVAGQAYKINSEAWQDSGSFTGLSSNTDYTVYTRVKATGTTFASADYLMSVTTKSVGSVTVPTPTAVTYDPDVTLEDITLAANWAWSAPATVPTVAINSYSAVYTPTDTVTVDYSGEAGYVNTSGTVTITRTISLTVNRAAPTAADFIYNAPTALVYSGTAKIAGVTAKDGISGMGAVTVKYYLGEVETTPTNAGTYTAEIDIAQGENYAAASAVTDGTWTFTIGKMAQAPLSITNKPTSDITYGDTFTLGTVGGSGTGTVTWEVTDGTSATVNVNTGAVTITGVNETTITATAAETDTYAKATASYTVTVAKKALTLKTDDKSMTKGEGLPAFTYTATGLVNGDTVTTPPTMSTVTDGTAVGAFDITITDGVVANAASYNITYTKGTLTVAERLFTVTVTNGTGSGNYAESATVTITANDRSGYTFTGWSGADVTFANAAAKTTTFTMPAKAVTVTANYRQNSAGGDGSGNTSSPTLTPDPGKTDKSGGKVEKEHLQNVGAPVVSVNNSSDELKSRVLTDAEQEMVENGENAKVILRVTDISASVSDEEKALVKEQLSSKKEDASQSVLYVDLSLYKQVGDREETKITETNGKMRISLEVPESFWNTDIKKSRAFYVVRIHDKEVTRIDGSYDPATHLFTFETDRFSTYALTYQDSSLQTYQDFYHLQLKAKANKTSQILSYKKAANVDGYLIYGAACGKKMKKLAEIPADVTSYTVKNLKSGTYYKYQVKAYRIIDGEQVIIMTSKVVHSVTEGKTYANPTKVTLKVTSVKLALGKTKTVSGQVVLPKGKKGKEHTAAVRYESNNKKVATVNSKGMITAKAKGICYVYAYAQNGVYKRIKVTVE